MTRYLLDDKDRPSRVLEMRGLPFFRACAPNRPALDLRQCMPGARYTEAEAAQDLYGTLDKTILLHEIARMVGRFPTGDRLRISDLTFSGKALSVSTQDDCQRLHIVKDDLVSDDYSLCHALSQYARTLAVDALLVPSAAVADGVNIVVFREAVSNTVTEHKWEIIRITEE
jgi:hypothetical protein